MAESQGVEANAVQLIQPYILMDGIPFCYLWTSYTNWHYHSEEPHGPLQ